ncbi:hypothetical protein [Flavobacterium lindanitolerans]|jgi:hypothetical protein|uniref:hypothetical protein n=1 Tax=Flavobacterium lindanitolerans TaxID=428988 RepID=UPI0023F1B74C|nr:hypothetical protein [Flavobacterium lindanitolerans]
MSREISDDYKTFTSFLERYDLNKHLENTDFIKSISSQHKKYFAYLTCIAELIHLKEIVITPKLLDEQILFLKESCSDIGNAFFSMLHGAYKPSRLMLRSSIETFMKGFNLDQYIDITTEKNLYKIFDTIKALNFFDDKLTKTIFNDIHQKYGKLCEDTHTATELNMQHITALNYFPKYDKNEVEAITKYISELVSCYIALLTLKYNAHFHKMHHRNKEILLTNIEKSIRPLIIGIQK